MKFQALAIVMAYAAGTLAEQQAGQQQSYQLLNQQEHAEQLQQLKAEQQRAQEVEMELAGMSEQQVQTFCKRFTREQCCGGGKFKRDEAGSLDLATFGSCAKCRGRSYTCPPRRRRRCGWWGCGPPPQCVRFGNCGQRGPRCGKFGCGGEFHGHGGGEWHGGHGGGEWHGGHGGGEWHGKHKDW